MTATVTHDFSDRDYVSVEEDVIYLDGVGERWLLAKPSGTFYRAVGYPEPPLRALTPPGLAPLLAAAAGAAAQLQALAALPRSFTTATRAPGARRVEDVT